MRKSILSMIFASGLSFADRVTATGTVTARSLRAKLKDCQNRNNDRRSMGVRPRHILRCVD
jgi:hypothetical protein